MKLFSAYSRELSWQLKSSLRYSPTLKKKRGIKNSDNLLLNFDSKKRQRLEQLKQNYQLDDWPRLCNQAEYIENLYLLDLLDQHLSDAASNGFGLDIGCRNFSHLPALTAFAACPWHGVELDANGRYWSGYTRRAYGKWMATQREGSHYIPGSLLEIEGNYKTIVWILPFVFPEPLEHWGLPARFFQPLQLLQQAWKLLSDDGVMLIVNQGELEAEEQKKLFATLGIKAKPLGELGSVFSPFKKRRYGWKIRKA